QFPEAAISANGLEVSFKHGSTLAIDGVRGQGNASGCRGSACTAEGDWPSAEGNAIPHVDQAVQTGEDIVELATEEEPHVVPAVELANEGYPGCGQLKLSGPNVLRVVGLGAAGKQCRQIAPQRVGAIRGAEYRGGGGEPEIRNAGVPGKGRPDGA